MSQAAIIGVVVLMMMSSSSSVAMLMMGGDDDKKTTGPSSPGPSSPGPSSPSSYDETINWIVTTESHSHPNAMLYLGEEVAATWSYWADPNTRWRVISTGVEDEFWLVTASDHHNPGKVLYVSDVEQYGKISFSDFNYDADKKWKFISGPNEGEFQIVTADSHVKPNIMLNSTTVDGAAGSVWPWTYYAKPDSMWTLVPHNP
jgi:hypothetical protein